MNECLKAPHCHCCTSETEVEPWERSQAILELGAAGNTVAVEKSQELAGGGPAG